MISLRQELIPDGWYFDEESYYLNNTFMHFRHPKKRWMEILPIAFDYYEKGKYTHEERKEFLALLRRLFKEQHGHGVKACDLKQSQFHQFLNIFEEAWKQKYLEMRASRKWWHPLRDLF
jgi:hypothetical protein